MNFWKKHLKRCEIVAGGKVLETSKTTVYLKYSILMGKALKCIYALKIILNICKTFIHYLGNFGFQKQNTNYKQLRNQPLSQKTIIHNTFVYTAVQI